MSRASKQRPTLARKPFVSVARGAWGGFLVHLRFVGNLESNVYWREHAAAMNAARVIAMTHPYMPSARTETR